MHLVGFIIKIYHDARSPVRQKFFTMLLCTVPCMVRGIVFPGGGHNNTYNCKSNINFIE